LVNSEFAGGKCGRGSLAMKTVWSRGFRVEKVIWISFGLGQGVLSSMLVISIISFCMLFPCLGVGVLKISVSIFSI
jgi:hypothetical protein